MTRQSFLHGHLAWHGALSALDAGDLDGALAVYRAADQARRLGPTRR